MDTVNNLSFAMLFKTYGSFVKIYEKPTQTFIVNEITVKMFYARDRDEKKWC